ncbi:MAG: integration host factor subunit beta [Myxococcales bacterium]|nr:integration host factor subunit beta [Myxococcales bacterium]
MTKSELVDALARHEGVQWATAEIVVNVLFDQVRHALVRGERVEIRGFGSFSAREYKGYTGRNPRSGAEIVVKPKVLPVFKVGKILRARVNGGVDTGGTD